MTNKERILKKCFEDVIWMAIRYAHGRNTYAPGMVRDAVESYKKLYPEWKLKRDVAISPLEEEPLSEFNFRGDYLNDLFDDNN